MSVSQNEFIASLCEPTSANFKHAMAQLGLTKPLFELTSFSSEKGTFRLNSLVDRKGLQHPFNDMLLACEHTTGPYGEMRLDISPDKLRELLLAYGTEQHLFQEHPIPAPARPVPALSAETIRLKNEFVATMEKDVSRKGFEHAMHHVGIDEHLFQVTMVINGAVKLNRYANRPGFENYAAFDALLNQLPQEHITKKDENNGITRFSIPVDEFAYLLAGYGAQENLLAKTPTNVVSTIDRGTLLTNLLLPLNAREALNVRRSALYCKSALQSIAELFPDSNHTTHIVLQYGDSTLQKPIGGLNNGAHTRQADAESFNAFLPQALADALSPMVTKETGNDVRSLIDMRIHANALAQAINQYVENPANPLGVQMGDKIKADIYSRAVS